MMSRALQMFVQMFVVVCTTAFCAMVRAEESPAKTADASVTGWMAELKAGFEKAYRERVVDAYAVGVAEAKQEYAAQVQLALKDAERAGDKQVAVVFRQESERVAAESWRMQPDDQDTSLEILRRVRRIYRERVSELNRVWDEASRKLVLEFESALVQGAKQLTARNLEGEVRRVLACRQELVSVWLPRMWEIHRGERVSAPEAASEKGASPGDGYPETGAPVSRKELEEAVKWVLNENGTIEVRQKGRMHFLQNVGDLPGGKVDFWCVKLTRPGFGRGLLPGELRQLSRFQSLIHLRVRGFDVAPEDWSFLAGLRQLQTLYITDSTLDARVGAWIGRCSDLRTLEVTACGGLSAEFFRGVAAGVPNLQHLRLARSQMDDTAGRELARFERLQFLAVDSTGLTPAGLPSWGGFRHLKHLYLFDGPWPRESLAGLSRNPMEGLGMLRSDSPEFAAQAALTAELFPKLKHLAIRGKVLAPNDAEVLAEHFRGLEQLSLQVTETSVEMARAIAKMHRLRKLDCRSPGLRDEVFQELLAIRGLRDLDVAGAPVSDRSVDAIQRAAANNLRELNIADTKISKETVAGLERRWKNLNIHIRNLDP